MSKDQNYGKQITQSLLDKLKEARKQFGDTITLGSEVSLCNYIPTGSFFLDLALLGGIPEGVGVMFSGDPKTGKTTMCLKAVASFQKKYPDKYAMWIDAENSFDPIWAAKHGVDLNRILVVRQKNAEDIVDKLDGLMSDPQLGLVVVDSIAMLNPSPIIDKSAADNHIAIPARLMSVMIRKLNYHLSNAMIEGRVLTILMINQWAIDVGKMFGDKRVLPGGKKQGYFAHVHVDFGGYKEEMCKEKGEESLLDHTVHRFTIKKTRLGSSILQGQFCLNRNIFRTDMNEGDIDEVAPILSYAATRGLVTGSGASAKMLTLPFTGEVIESKTFKGLEEQLLANPDKYAELKLALITEHRERIKTPKLPEDGYLIDRVWDKDYVQTPQAAG